MKKDYKTTLKELTGKYAENYEHQPHYKNKRAYLRDFQNHFGENALLSNIRFVDIETYINKLRQQTTKRGTLPTEANINRKIDCLHHLFVKAK